MGKRTEMGRRDPEARREAILEAALAVFAAEGFAAARLDHVAERAGVAKGTIYLHFRDKQDLFEQMVRAAVFPVVDRLEALSKAPDLPVDKALRSMFEVFRTEVLGTSRKDLMRLVLTEGPRFPAIAEFYHREVISRGMRFMKELLRRGEARGELSAAGLARFPQLVLGPFVLAVIWDGLFSAIEPLDVKGLLEVHLRLLLSETDEGERT